MADSPRRGAVNAGVYLKAIFVKIVNYLEVCALPYLVGIAAAVGLDIKIPQNAWELLSRLGVIGTVLALYAPIAILHVVYILHLKNRHADKSPIFFLEDRLTEHRFTSFLAVGAAAVSLVFGVVNYNFAVDVSHPQHVSHFVKKPWETNPVSLEGKIIREPDFREHAVWLYIQPRTIDNREQIAKGLVLVQVGRAVEGFENYEYGQYVRVRGNLVEPEPATNPETFDYKRWLNNRNVFGLMRVSKEENMEYLGLKESNPIFDISLWVKKKFLAVMKQTLPYPESAFQGGIIYGLKTGLDPVIHFEFKWAGMAWVLVVAGAHLLMVYITLKMILGSIRPNPKIAFCILFVLLIMFLILTGINPPTVRAFIMIMLYEFTKVFLGQDIRAAVRSAIGIAAFLLLSSHVFPYFSPLLIFEPTVTLSFGAVLSLIYLSRPIEHILRRYCYGMTSVVILAGGMAILVTVSVLRPPTLSLLGIQILPATLVTLVLAIITSRINNKYRDQYQLDQIYLGYNDARKFHGWQRWIHPTFLTYNSLPKWILGFVGAQIAIQFGMVMPLSSLYFQRSPVGGLLVNILAFPALGVIIQVGLVAVLFGMIPVIGLPIAFILNAADYLGIKFLMFLASWSKEYFPYPMAMKPDGSQILLYYGILTAFVLFDRIFYSFEKHGYMTIREVLERKAMFTKSPVYYGMLPWLNTKKKELLFIGAVLVLLTGIGCWMAQGKHLDHLQVIVMDLDEGGGSIIQTPDGLRFLVDGGKIPWNARFDVGERTIAPTLLGQQIEHIDGIFITSLTPENIGGLPFILENFTIGRIYVPFAPSILNGEREFTAEDYAQLDGRVGRSRNDRQIAETVEKMKIWVRERKIPVIRLVEGSALFKTGPLQIEALNPVKDKTAAANHNVRNNSLVLRLTYGGSAILLAGDINEEGEADLLKRAKDMKANFVLIPSHGSDKASTEDFVKAVRPQYAAAQYRRPPFRRRDDEADPFDTILRRYADVGAKLFRTDLNGAVTVNAWADGRFSVTPMLSTIIMAVEAGAEDELDTDVGDRLLLKSEGTGL